MVRQTVSRHRADYLCYLHRRSRHACRNRHPSEMQIYEFGKLPLVYEGRVKPYDTLARNTLQILSGRQELGVLNDKGEVAFMRTCHSLAARCYFRRRGRQRRSSFPHRKSRPARYARFASPATVLSLLVQ